MSITETSPLPIRTQKQALAEATFDGLIASFWKAPHHMDTQAIARLLNVRECRVANRLAALREMGAL